MSVPTAELTAPASGAHWGGLTPALSKRLTGARLYLALGAGALTIGLISLAFPSTPSYDPWAWLVWGREIVHLKLHTTGGPTWKPLTVLLTTVLALFGKAAPDLWLAVARAGAAVAVAMVFRLCFRIIRAIGEGLSADPERRASPVAACAPALLGATIAAVGLAFTGGFLSNSALGYSEGLLLALVLIAVERHLDGEPRQAFAVGFAAALDRPELWLFWGPYGLWLFWRDPGARKLVVGLFLLIPVLWFAPEYWGSGHFFRGVNRAHTPRSNSAAFAPCPFCSELVKHAWPTVLLRIKVAATLGVGSAAWLLARAMRLRSTGQGWRGWRPSGPREHALAATAGAGLLGLTWWVLISVLTQAGFSGNDRYLVLGAALIELSGGVAFGWLAIVLARQVRLRVPSLHPRATALSVAAAALVALVFTFVPNQVGNNLIDVQRTHRSLVYQAHLRTSAAGAVAKLGGTARIFQCGSVMTEGFQVPMLAWTLGVHTDQVQAAPVGHGPPPPAPNVIFQAKEHHHAHRLPSLGTWPAIHYRLVLHNRTFRIYEHCKL